jgi:hypothetical protein
VRFAGGAASDIQAWRASRDKKPSINADLPFTASHHPPDGGDTAASCLHPLHIAVALNHSIASNRSVRFANRNPFEIVNVNILVGWQTLFPRVPWRSRGQQHTLQACGTASPQREIIHESPLTPQQPTWLQCTICVQRGKTACGVNTRMTGELTPHACMRLRSGARAPCAPDAPCCEQLPMQPWLLQVRELTHRPGHSVQGCVRMPMIGSVFL